MNKVQRRRRRKYPIGEYPYFFSVYGSKFRVPIIELDGRHKRRKLGFIVNNLRRILAEMVQHAYPPAHFEAFADGILTGTDRPGFSKPIMKVGFPPNPN